MGNKIKGFIEVETDYFLNDKKYHEIDLINVNDISAVAYDTQSNNVIIKFTNGFRVSTTESYESLKEKIRASQFM